MNYTLLAYKPDSDDYCRGCVMARYSADFKWQTSANPAEIVEAAAQLMMENKFMDTSEAGYELTLLENGVEDDTDDLLGQARVKAEGLVAARKERERQEKEVAQQRAARAAQALEREQYEKLKAKFA